MRDLTKSVTSYTWAMSVFSVQQMFNLLGLGGSGSWNRSTRAFNNVTEATAQEMGDTMRAVFRSGDTLQRGMVDLFLAPFSLGNWTSGTGQRRDRDGRDGGGARRDWSPDASGGGMSEEYRSGGHRNRDSRDRTDDGGGWMDAAARVAQAGADVMQATVDTAAHTTRRAADSVSNQDDDSEYSNRSSAPHASDPSLGWRPGSR
jgi:hypothetical protein